MKKLLQQCSLGIFASLLLCLNLPASAQTLVRVQMKLPPAGKVGTHYAYQALSLYNTESGTKTIRLKVIVSETSAGTVYEAESGNFECPPGYSSLEPSVIQSVNVTQINPAIGDYIKRYQSLPGGNYKLCVTVFVAGSNSPAGRDCYEESVIETDPALPREQVPPATSEMEAANQVKKMFGAYEFTMDCDKKRVQPGERLTFRIILKSGSLKNITGIRITAPFPAVFALQEKSLSIRRNGQALSAIAQDKYALLLNDGEIVLQTDEELALQEEMILTYTVIISPDAQAALIENNNVIIETTSPETKNLLSAGPFIEILR